MPADSSAWAYILVGLGSSGLVLVGQVFLRRQQRDQLIADASDKVAEGASTILEEYRRLLERSQAELNELRERIAKLELALKLATSDRERIDRERQVALRELGKVKERVHQLEAQLRLLEGAVERREPRRTDDP